MIVAKHVTGCSILIILTRLWAHSFLSRLFLCTLCHQEMLRAVSAKYQNLYTSSPLMSAVFSKHGVVQESHSHLGNVIQLSRTCSSVSWSWSHCLVCWKPSGEGWQPETCRIMGLIRFGGLCAIWLVWRESHLKHINSTWDQITPSTVRLATSTSVLSINHLAA